MTTEELAKRFNKSSATLRNWRWRGYGPSFRKIGNSVDYALEDVEAWEKEQTVQPSKAVA